MRQANDEYELREIQAEWDLPPDQPSMWDERDDEPYDHNEEDEDA